MSVRRLLDVSILRARDFIFLLYIIPYDGAIKRILWSDRRYISYRRFRDAPNSATAR